MKLLTIHNGSQYKLGVLTKQGIIDVENVASLFDYSVPHTMETLIESGRAGYKTIEKLIELVEPEPTLHLSPESIKYGPCVTNPQKILCVGLNYRKHAEETNAKIPISPVLFNKFNNTLAAHEAIIKIPQPVEHMDYEVELVIVMGKTAYNVPEAGALSYVFGYTVGNDLSDRILQSKTSQFLLGKNCDGFAPIGPYVTTANEIADPNNLHLESRVNGEIRQSSNTRDMIFSCAFLISYISRYMTLKPGDLIFTGTPQGVIFGKPQEKQIWLKSGDEVVASVEGIGDLCTLLS